MIREQRTNVEAVSEAQRAAGTCGVLRRAESMVFAHVRDQDRPMTSSEIYRWWVEKRRIRSIGGRERFEGMLRRLEDLGLLVSMRGSHRGGIKWRAAASAVGSSVCDDGAPASPPLLEQLELRW